MWQRYRKTPTESKKGIERSTIYKQFDAEGRIICTLTVEDDSLAELTLEERKELISAMHRMDDRECDSNNKENRLDPISEADYKRKKEAYDADFEKKFGRKPGRGEQLEGGHRNSISIEGMFESDDEDTGMLGYRARFEKASSTQDDFAQFESEKAADLLKDLISHELTEREKQAVCLVGLEGLSRKKAGEKMGIKGQRVGQLYDNALKKLSENENLKKFFRNFN